MPCFDLKNKAYVGSWAYGKLFGFEPSPIPMYTMQSISSVGKPFLHCGLHRDGAHGSPTARATVLQTKISLRLINVVTRADEV